MYRPDWKTEAGSCHRSKSLRVFEEEYDLIFGRCYAAQKRSKQKLELCKGLAAHGRAAALSIVVVSCQFGKGGDQSSQQTNLGSYSEWSQIQSLFWRCHHDHREDTWYSVRGRRRQDQQIAESALCIGRTDLNQLLRLPLFLSNCSTRLVPIDKFTCCQ